MLTVPFVLIRPIESTLVNQSAPSGPAVIVFGAGMTSTLGAVWVRMLPLVVIRPIDVPGSGELMNQRAPSGPAVIAVGTLMRGLLKMRMLPLVLIRPIESLLVNQRAPSGPAVMASASLMRGSV